ncbi:adenylate cyclase type 2-like protein [Leptotrombidium deliense]|uniref:adenylate cyclase n=1 Tax=Leptotrombidium deliense TaxID=299467 RepID=A0A443SLU6_9ACAR|nr:adenylate cyclase type 2-like protein [Leptotrombidium deliense]
MASMTVFIAMLFAEYGGALFSIIGDTSSYSLLRVRPTFYLIIMNQVFLPFPSKIYSCVTTAIIIALELSLTILSRFQSQCSTDVIIRFTVADFVFYLISGAIGFFLNFFVEVTNRRAFLNNKSCVESKLKLDSETEQQNQLLLSCLPQHLTERVRNDIKTIISKLHREQRIPLRPFNELYVEKYRNVSILYADIVNSMILPTKLNAEELVETLNELFGSFDESAEQNNCLRIKLLGDCYYCVSGVPLHDSNHALNCVRMGLEMIQIIATMREERDLNINMRIGVHSGMVLSGLLGLRKWQYDIWSIDCMIASSMEHQGVAGYVHCTKATLDLIPKPNLKDLQKYRDILASVNEKIEENIEEMPLSKKVQWCNPEGINPLLLTFTPKALKTDISLWQLEREFATQPDPLFKYYLYCTVVIFLTLIAVKLIALNFVLSQRLQWSLVVSGILMTFFVLFAHYSKKDVKYLYRIIIWIIVTLLLLICSTIDIIDGNCIRNILSEAVKNCASAKYYTCCLILTLMSISLLIRVSIWLKLLFNVVSVLAFVTLTKTICSVFMLIENSDTNIFGTSFNFSHLYYVVVVAILVHVLDRQIEYILRLDFQWTTRLEVEKREAMAMGDVNQILLENILPKHVAERFLYSSSSKGKLYHETYDCIAVMFASIPNYVNFYTETNINDDGLKCLQLLNEIICDFDKLLSLPTFFRIEKIKTIGSTYMAAAGLHPGRGSTDSDVSVEDVCCNVIQLVRFASALMETLQRINKDALQEFKLRVGIAVGPVIAGVVGAAKPQYDIWGDTVNMASRMDSTGIAGRIHVTEAVKEVLTTSEAYSVECRGLTMVKGKGHVITYLVETPFDFEETNATVDSV